MTTYSAEIPIAKPLVRTIVAGLFWALATIPLVAQSISFDPPQRTISVAPGFDHADVRVPVSTAEPDFDFSTLAVVSDAPWVTPTVDVDTGEIVLSFSTANLTVSSHTATITATANDENALLFINAKVAPLNLVRLRDDPVRSLVYGIHQSGTELGSVVVYDPIHDTRIANITVGAKPTGLAVSSDGGELLVLNTHGQSISVIDLSTLAVMETIALPIFGTHTTGAGMGKIGIGPGAIVYYTDGAWAPALHVYDRSSGTVIQTVMIEGGGSYGFGDFAANRDLTRLYGWAQYGYGAGWMGSYISRFSIAPDGRLTFIEKTSSSTPTVLSRDPLETPVLIAKDGGRVFIKQLAVRADSVTTTERAFPGPVYSIAPGGEIACTEASIYETATGNFLLNLPVSTRVQTVTKDYARLVFFNPTSRLLQTINLLAEIDPAILGCALTPADGAVVSSPPFLGWVPVPEATAYHVYLANQDVSGADTTNSPFFQGTVTDPVFVIEGLLTPGATYYWRVDSVSVSGVETGNVHSFTISNFSTSTNSLNVVTVQGHANLRVPIALDAAISGQTWSATASVPWISFESSTGTTPCILGVIIDASDLAAGAYSAQISIVDEADATMNVPVCLTVEPLSLTHIKSDPQSATVYAVSEAGGSAPRAYLLEIDAQSERIERVLYVGSSVTDLALHPGERRLYLPNWNRGFLLAVDMDSFGIVQSNSYPDAFRVAPAATGRLVIEGEDQWITISLFDTATGATLTGTRAREGGGATSPDGRYYYHGDNNISDASLHKYDLLGDSFAHLANNRVANVSYYGSRIVVVSENGQRIFYNGAMFNPSLVNLWDVNATIHSTSWDGRLAFGQNTIFNTEMKQQVLAMPASAAVSAFNSTTEKLIVQVGTRLRFYTLSDPLTLPAPMLTLSGSTDTSVSLTWSYSALSMGFTLQYREEGAGAWTDAASDIGVQQSAWTITGLTQATNYKFRIKANSPAYVGAWSDIVSATTLLQTPTAPSLHVPDLTEVGIALSWSPSNIGDRYIVERKLEGNPDWTVIATLPFTQHAHFDSDIQPSATYSYRVKAGNGAVESAASNIRSVTTPAPQMPPAPANLEAATISSEAISIAWSPVEDVLGYALERRTDEDSLWTLLAFVPAGDTDYIDTNVTAGTWYWYRVSALNQHGSSQPSNTDRARAVDYVFIFQDDFDPDIDALLWDVVLGGAPYEPARGGHDRNALFFNGESARSAATIPLDTTVAESITFMIRAGNLEIDGPEWDDSEAGEHVLLEYSNDGLNWYTLTILETTDPAMKSWTQITVPVPNEARTRHSRFRWRQHQHSGPGLDVWVLDDIVILSEPPPAPPKPTHIFAVAISDKRVGVMWFTDPGASRYVIERQSVGVGWSTIATVSSLHTFFTDDTVLPSRLYGYRIKAVNEGGESAYTWTAFVTTYSQIEAWLLENYGTTEATGAAAPMATDQDGVENVVKFAYNLKVGEPVAHLEPSLGKEGFPAFWFDPATRRLTGEIVRRNPDNDPGVSYLIQFSDDLIEWETVQNITSVHPIDQVWERVRFEDTPVANPARRFGRVVVVNEF